MPGAPVVKIKATDLQQAALGLPSTKDSTGGSRDTVHHLQVPQKTEHERDPVAKIPDSPRQEQTGTFAKWFANCQCSRRTKIVGLTAIAALGASIAAYVAIQKGYVTVPNMPNMPEIKMPEFSSCRQSMPWQDTETAGQTSEESAQPGAETPKTEL